MAGPRRRVAFGGVPSGDAATGSCMDEAIPAVERLWSYITQHACGKTRKTEHLDDEERTLGIAIDVMALFSEDPALARLVLGDPRDVQRRLREFLMELSLVASRDRVWLRLLSVPFPFMTIEEMYALGKRRGLKSAVYSRCLKCVFCGEEKTRMELEDEQRHEICCLEQSLNPKLEENQKSRVIVSVQKLTVSVFAVRSPRTAGTGAGFRPFEREALELTVYDDLTCHFKLGDAVELFGLAALQPVPLSKSASTLPGHLVLLQVESYGLRQMQSTWEIFGPVVRPVCDGREAGDLEFVCRLAQRALPRLHPPSFLLASLLSGAAAGTHTAEGMRDQIHILLTSYGYDSYALQMMEEISAVLAPINALCSFESTGATCHIISGSKGQILGLKAEPLVLSRTGISVVDVEHLSKAERKKCTEYLGSKQYTLCSGAEYSFPVTTTLWATVQSHPPTNGRPGLVAHLGEEFSDLFDIVIPFSVENDPLYDEHSLRRLAHVDDEDVEGAREQLRALLKRSMEFAVPRMSRESRELIQSYYTYVRNPRAFEEHLHQRSVSVHVLHSLIRLATASARLTLSPIVRPVPDVTLAIKLTEETLLETPSRLMLEMESLSHQCSYTSLDAELSALREMLSKTFSSPSRMAAED